MGEEKICFESIEDFHLDHIFDCGQCFRWDRQKDGSYIGIAGGHIAEIRTVSIGQKDTASLDLREGKASGAPMVTVEIDGGGSREFWQDYLDLGRNYGDIKRELKKRNRQIGQAIDYGYGIRILNQQRWETLVSFIISANNNIKRIRNNINHIAQLFGKEAGIFRGKKYYNLPEPHVLAKLTVDDLAPCKLGYRAPYLIKTGQMVADEGEITYERLNNYVGVGPKVANCISLFSMGRMDSFPIDTWVKKVMKHMYGLEGNREIADFAKTTFGQYGGIAQQYLFYYMRDRNI